MKRIIFFLFFSCLTIVKAEKSQIENFLPFELKLNLNLSKVELSVDSRAVKYEKYFHEAYKNPYKAIKVDNEYHLKPGWPRAWPEEVESFIRYNPEELKISFWQLSGFSNSIKYTMICLILMIITLLGMFFDRNDNSSMAGIFFLVLSIIALINLLILKFYFAAIFCFFALVSNISTDDKMGANSIEEKNKFYSTWAINFLSLVGTVAFFVLGK